MLTEKVRTIDDYIADFPSQTQELLELVRETIRQAAPEASEVIGYSMPAFKQNGILLYFAAYKNHIGFYPTASGIENFKTELTGYKSTKGGVQFPLNKPIPYNLIAIITAFRVKEDKAKGKKK